MDEKEVVLMLDAVRNNIRAMQTDCELLDKQLKKIEDYFE